ncbi:PREDICTED: amine sulfotransferase-like [Rhagoletis zephyria]|uniref:amine sulfotransferase-like n=1 Tax=Rhagoletis zephyria TaxID=28612 RepID=UPI0008117D95|nr:PREDICTED: amine sulfotransferase-like [Rhagoletis zephyria]
MEEVPVHAKSYPTNLLNKDWTKRKLFENSGQAFVDKVHDMEVKDDDVWLVTLPKCGTTWMQELLWLVLNDFDFETARNEHLEVRTPFLEFDYILHHDLNHALAPVEALKSPRLIKTHMPLPLLPQQLWNKKPKVVYVYRNPKDYIVSCFYHLRSLGVNMDSTLEKFTLEYTEEDKTVPTDDFEHVTEFYELRNEPWIYYTSFECMKEDLRTVIEEICKFLGKNISEEQMEQMLQHLSFEEMKKNPKVNHCWEFEQLRAKYKNKHEDHNFIRRGQAGGYKDELSADVIGKMDAWIQRNLEHYKLSLNELLLLNVNAAL